MGLLDHRRTWHFTVAATPEACHECFRKAITAKTGLRLRAVNWHLRRATVTPRTGEPAVNASIATYQERAGLAAVSTGIVGARAERVERGAVGSELTFTATARPDGGGSECFLWLSKHGSWLGFTNDAGFFRGYMTAVERRLREADPKLSLSKN